ncbi:hypothetical protein CHM34_09850 [Paludifilum halophilum]|uniref:Competence protein ComGF n=1 Tax=Paludifilum halophilum TaxID=1642702 RepID=A0A235B636_9BACL|nr:hypothetical protein CHM34_09850 [Paludifilum halophilum]
MVIIIPAVMNLYLSMERDLKKIVGKQHLQGEAAAWMTDFRDEVKSGRHFRLTEEGWLLFERSSGDTVRYSHDRRRLVRSVRRAGEKRFKGRTVMAHNVYIVTFATDREGVFVDIGLQNWHSDVSYQTYIRGRAP